MPTRRFFRGLAAVWLLLAIAVLGVRVALAHCDGLDGPVVKAAAKALRSGNVNLVLIWVSDKDEAEIRHAFQQAMLVRKQGPEARALADRHFFETVVRVHRAGEGAPYIGLAPAGRDLGPAIPAADRAAESGVLGPLEDLLVEAVQRRLEEDFAKLKALRDYNPDDVAAGRRYVQTYVRYIHYVERLYQAATGAAEGHYAEATHK